MGHEDRERKFEQALARHLRAGTAHETDTNAPAPVEGRASITCPDAAMLAAFHEGALFSEEMSVVKEHIAACSRCQEILAHLEATDEIAVDTKKENAALMGEPVWAGSAGYEDEHLAAAAIVAPQPAQALRVPRDISRTRSAKVWRWVAPTGAIAAGLLLWAVTHGNKPQTLRPVEKIQVAEERPAEVTMAPGPGTPSQTRQLDDSRGTKRGMQQLAEGFGAGNSRAGRRRDTPADEMRREYGVESSRRAAPAKPDENVARNDEVTSAVAPVPANGARETMTKKTEDLPVTASNTAPIRTGDILTEEKLEASSGVAETADRAQPSAPPSEMAKTTAKPSVDARVEKKESDRISTMVVTSQGEVTADYEAATSSVKNKASNANLILAPGGTVLWRLGRAGRIERSVDSGITWSQQSSGVRFDLLTGSASSEAVCWIAGRSGTILRTADGGGHWTKIVSPIAGEVVRIRAVDAMHATIFDTSERVNAKKHASFATSDGGVTWSPAKD